MSPIRKPVGGLPTAIMLLGVVLGLLGPVTSAILYWSRVKGWMVVAPGAGRWDQLLVQASGSVGAFGLTVQGLIIIGVLLVTGALVVFRSAVGAVAGIVAGLLLLAVSGAAVLLVDGPTDWMFWADLALRWGVPGILLCIGGIIGLVSPSSSPRVLDAPPP